MKLTKLKLRQLIKEELQDAAAASADSAQDMIRVAIMEPGGLLNKIIWILEDSESESARILIEPIEDLKLALKKVLL